MNIVMTYVSRADGKTRTLDVPVSRDIIDRDYEAGAGITVVPWSQEDREALYITEVRVG